MIICVALGAMEMSFVSGIDSYIMQALCALNKPLMLENK
jgi:hypothetical protein